ncbi:MAG: glutathione binding-like protein, partial [Pseudorhodoplanes sp.]
LKDGDFVLWESNTILRYLSRKEGKVLLPADPKAAALAEQWIDWQTTNYNTQLGPAFINMIRTPPEKRDMAAVETARKNTIARAKILDAHLGKNAYVAGDKFSMGDIPAAITTFRFWQLVPEHPPLPNVRRWYDAIAARKPFQEHVGSIKLT